VAPPPDVRDGASGRPGWPGQIGSDRIASARLLLSCELRVACRPHVPPHESCHRPRGAGARARLHEARAVVTGGWGIRLGEWTRAEPRAEYAPAPPRARHRIRGVGYADHAARRGVGTKRKVASLVEEGNMPAPALAPCAQHGRGAGADAVPEMRAARPRSSRLLGRARESAVRGLRDRPRRGRGHRQSLSLTPRRRV